MQHPHRHLENETPTQRNFQKASFSKKSLKSIIFKEISENKELHRNLGKYRFTKTSTQCSIRIEISEIKHVHRNLETLFFHKSPCVCTHCSLLRTCCPEEKYVQNKTCAKKLREENSEKKPFK